MAHSSVAVMIGVLGILFIPVVIEPTGVDPRLSGWIDSIAISIWHAVVSRLMPNESQGVQEERRGKVRTLKERSQKILMVI